jgi:hypothetical protein
MVNVLYVIGEILLIAALLGLLAVPVWLVMMALHVKNTTLGHAKRMSQRPIAAVKNLIATGKGIAQQETVRVKHIAGSGKVAVGAVQHSAVHIQAAARTVHPEDLRPAKDTLQNAGKVLSLVAKLSRAGVRQGRR